MSSKSYTGKESDPLINGTLEILEREYIDEGVACRRGVWFRAELKGRTHS